MKKIIIGVLSLAIILGFLFWRFGPQLGGQADKGPITLTFWGLWEDDNQIKPLLAEYTKRNPNISVNYVRQSSLNYRTRAQTQIREGVGPDVFMIHNTWLPMFESDITPVPVATMKLDEYRNMFYPISEQNFVKQDRIYAIPGEIDGLAMYINEDILQGIGGKVPRNWQEFIDSAIKATVKDESGQIRTSGAAMGTTSNIDHWSDIIGLLLLQQPNVDPSSPSSSSAAEVLSFYTGFVTDPQKKSWDVNLPSSTQMFAEGRLGFYFAPSWRAHELRQANPNLKFRVVAVPQLSGNQVGWASYWAYTVSSQSKFSKEAWDFVKFMTSEEIQKMAYAQAAQVRLFGQPYSLVSLTPEISNDPIVGSFVTQGPTYKSWYLSSSTYDAGLNDEMIKYWEDGVNATLQGTDPQVALQTVASGVTQVLDKYTKPASIASPR